MLNKSSLFDTYIKAVIIVSSVFVASAYVSIIITELFQRCGDTCGNIYGIN